MCCNNVVSTLARSVGRVMTLLCSNAAVFVAEYCLLFYPSVGLGLVSFIWATTWQNQQNECAPSEDSSAQPDQSSLSTQWVDMGTNFLHADSEDWSETLIWVFAGRTLILLVLSCCGSIIKFDTVCWCYSDLSLHWVHTHFVGFVMLWLNYKIWPCVLVLFWSESSLGAHSFLLVLSCCSSVIKFDPVCWCHSVPRATV